MHPFSTVALLQIADKVRSTSASPVEALPGPQVRERSKVALAEPIGVCYHMNMPRQEEVRAKNRPLGRVAGGLTCTLKLQLLLTAEWRPGWLQSRAEPTALWIVIL